MCRMCVKAILNIMRCNKNKKGKSFKMAKKTLSNILISSHIANVGQFRPPECYQLWTVAQNYKTWNIFLNYSTCSSVHDHVYWIMNCKYNAQHNRCTL